jgi:hypothetical protein
LETTVIVDVLLDLGGLIRGDALGKLLTAEKTLEDIVGAAAGGVATGRFEKLPAQGPAAEAVDGLHLLEEGGLF